MSEGRTLTPPVRFGPVEVTVIALRDAVPSASVLHALAAQVFDGVVRVLDFVVLSKDAAGRLLVEEVDPDDFGLTGLELHAPGIAGDEDLEAIGAAIPPSGAVAVVVLELLWAGELAERVAEGGNVVLTSARIPASVVNVVAELAADD